MLMGYAAPFDNSNYPFWYINSSRSVTTIVPPDKLDEARASVVLQHPNNTIISESEYEVTGFLNNRNTSESAYSVIYPIDTTENAVTWTLIVCCKFKSFTASA